DDYSETLKCGSNLSYLVPKFILNLKPYSDINLGLRPSNDVYVKTFVLQYKSSRGLANHTVMWIAKAKYLSLPVDPYDLVGIITQHYLTPL
ncbi:Hypothetical protein CINCED_3A025496, partial [Cinara cedri]